MKKRSFFKLHGREYIPGYGWFPYSKRLNDYIESNNIPKEELETDENRLNVTNALVYHATITIPFLGISGEIIYKTIESLLK